MTTTGRTIWHVEADGNDLDGNGSAYRPFQSYERALIEHRPGDEIWFGCVGTSEPVNPPRKFAELSTRARIGLIVAGTTAAWAAFALLVVAFANNPAAGIVLGLTYAAGYLYIDGINRGTK